MIDTHCHIDEEAYAADREEVIARQRASGVEAMIVPGVNAASIEPILDISRAHPGFCYSALGFHPQDVKADWQEQLTTIETAIRAHRDELVAIGEIGLDYYWDKTFKAEQQEVLRRQLLLARELDLPVILHNREATEDIMQIVKEISNLQSPISNLRGVMHCYNGSKETAEEILRMGLYLGIGGVITFKNCKLAETLRELNSQPSLSQHSLSQPSLSQHSSLISQLLLETDGPYLAPTPHRGERNESRWMTYVVERLAESLGLGQESLDLAGTVHREFVFFGELIHTHDRNDIL